MITSIHVMQGVIREKGGEVKPVRHNRTTLIMGVNTALGGFFRHGLRTYFRYRRVCIDNRHLSTASFHHCKFLYDKNQFFPC
nr:hypothetical protein [Paenibacillus larvae]